jgi:hypothetical protein
VVLLQIRHIKDRDLGFNKDRLVEIDPQSHIWRTFIRQRYGQCGRPASGPMGARCASSRVEMRVIPCGGCPPGWSGLRGRTGN